MSVSQEPVSTLPTSGPAVLVKIFPSVFSMTSTNGLPSSATALTRPKKC
jgi:hypothetical protein